MSDSVSPSNAANVANAANSRNACGWKRELPVGGEGAGKPMPSLLTAGGGGGGSGGRGGGGQGMTERATPHSIPYVPSSTASSPEEAAEVMHGSASDRTTQQNRRTHGERQIERQIDRQRGRRGEERCAAAGIV